MRIDPVDNDAQARALIDNLSARARTERVAWSGGQVCWRGFGRGTPVVLVHGGHGNWLHWVRNIEALAAHHTVWAVDLPGFGDSDVPDGEGMASLLAPTLSTLDALIGPDTPVNLVGFSFGGLVAAHLAAQRPHVQRLVLLGTGGHQGRRRPKGELTNWKPAWREGDAVALEQAMRHNLAMHMLSGAAADLDALAVRVHTDACVRTRFRSKDISRAGGLVEVLAHCPGPTWLVWGEHDVTADPDNIAPVLASALVDGRSDVVDAAGHWVQYERADAVNPMLLAWLGSAAEAPITSPRTAPRG
ncbi:alpha/beta fold hydrolase [Hydrogenophaga sp.]|uniref:alpha/beta fold hydrolase n=1 Tax=Hydrogenophaga sp. TaxID=1904254 RepID=UPI0025C2AD0E|nr:alpha/beta fold hydrolase [Hydrogenophaga sp.]MBT9463862.1 alpha/beta fold hydrolase [Hydrogenophaga sp.]